MFKSKWFMLIVGAVVAYFAYPQLKPHVDKLMDGFKKKEA